MKDEIQHYLDNGYFTAAALKTLGRLPLAVVHGIGTMVGRLMWLIPNESRRVTELNIELCFPDESPSWRRKLVQRSLIETAKTACEMGVVWTKPIATTLKRVTSADGVELIEQAQADGKGVIILAPHLGNWEILGNFLAERWPITNLYQPPEQKAMDELIYSARVRCGAKLAPTSRRGVVKIVKALRKGELTGILPDQEPDHGFGGEFVPFFGTKALTATIIPKLLSEGRAVAIGGFCLRDGRGNYKIHFRPVHKGIHSSNLKTATACMNRSIEDFIKECPEQYQWEYKRFNRRPVGQEKIYNPGRVQGKGPGKQQVKNKN